MHIPDPLERPQNSLGFRLGTLGVSASSLQGVTRQWTPPMGSVGGPTRRPCAPYMTTAAASWPAPGRNRDRENLPRIYETLTFFRLVWTGVYTRCTPSVHLAPSVHLVYT